MDIDETFTPRQARFYTALYDARWFPEERLPEEIIIGLYNQYIRDSDNYHILIDYQLFNFHTEYFPYTFEPTNDPVQKIYNDSRKRELVNILHRVTRHALSKSNPPLCLLRRIYYFKYPHNEKYSNALIAFLYMNYPKLLSWILYLCIEENYYRIIKIISRYAIKPVKYIPRYIQYKLDNYDKMVAENAASRRFIPGIGRRIADFI